MHLRKPAVSSAVIFVLAVAVGAQDTSLIPELVSPPNGSSVLLSRLQSEGLQWNPVTGAVKYEVEITGPIGFNSGMPYTTSTTQTSLLFGPGGVSTTFMGTYSWRVRAVLGEDEEGGEGPFSEKWTFVVSMPPTPTPTYAPVPTPVLDRNDDGVIDYRDLYNVTRSWSAPGQDRPGLSDYAPHFGRKNVTPTPTPTPVLAAPTSLRVLLAGEPISTEQAIPTAQVGDIVLDWDDVIGLEPVTYDVAVTGSRPQASVAFYGLPRSEIRPYSGYHGLYPGKYLWQVQAVDAAGHRSPVSEGSFTLQASQAPAIVVDPDTEPEFDMDSDGTFEAGDLYWFSRLWLDQENPQGDYNRDGKIDSNDVPHLVEAISSRQLPAPEFTTIDIYNPPIAGNPATYNRTIPAMPPLALRIFELAFCEIHFEPVESAVDYEITIKGVTNDSNWPIGSRFYTGGQTSITFMLGEVQRWTPTSPGSYRIFVRAISPKGLPGKKSTELTVALSSY